MQVKMDNPPPPESLGDSLAVIAALRGENARLLADNAVLRDGGALLRLELDRCLARVSDLESRLRKDSSNSGKPPSSDGLGRRNRQSRSLRKKSGRKPGGQLGHPGATLSPSPSPDAERVHPAPCSCPGCGVSLDGVPETEERRQTFGYRVIPWIEGHVSKVKSCPGCGARVAGAFPHGVSAPVQYAPEVKGLAGYLLNRQYLPYNRTAELMGEVFNLKISPGTLVSWQEAIAGNLSGAVEGIRGLVAASPVIHVDETGMRAGGVNHWAHTASTDKAVHYHFDRRRGHEAIDRAGVLPGFKGTAVHDRFAAYDKYDGCAHSLCWAHLSRDLKHLSEARGWKWAGRMLELFGRMREAIGGDAKTIRGCRIAYGKILAEAGRENPPPKSGNRRGERNKESDRLQKALDKRRKEVLRPLDDPLVPPDNNQAERSLRMLKVKQKVSGGFRNPDHGGLFATIASYIETARRNGISPIQAFADAVAGTPHIPGVTNVNPA